MQRAVPFLNQPEKVAPATVPHFETWVACDCCAISLIASTSPASWRYVEKRLMCPDCCARLAALMAVCTDQLLEERGGINARVGWRYEKLKFGPVAPAPRLAESAEAASTQDRGTNT